jgi:ferrous iron transport protein A
MGGDPEALRRLMEMGLMRGTAVEVVRRAPLGDPLEVKVRGFMLTLRRSEAEHIEVE